MIQSSKKGKGHKNVEGKYQTFGILGLLVYLLFPGDNDAVARSLNNQPTVTTNGAIVFLALTLDKSLKVSLYLMNNPALER